MAHWHAYCFHPVKKSGQLLPSIKVKSTPTHKVFIPLRSPVSYYPKTSVLKKKNSRFHPVKKSGQLLPAQLDYACFVIASFHPVKKSGQLLPRAITNARIDGVVFIPLRSPVSYYRELYTRVTTTTRVFIPLRSPVSYYHARNTKAERYESFHPVKKSGQLLPFFYFFWFGFILFSSR